MSQTINVTLPSDTLYVSGTVNSVAYTWTNVEGNTWQAIVEKSTDGKYVIELTIINSSGNSREQTLTLYYGLNLITDRTWMDVQRAQYLNDLWVGGVFLGTKEELAEWFGDLKGAYNAYDLNRVAAAIHYVADRLTECGERIVVTPKTDWLENEIPTPAQLAAYLAEVTTIRGALAVMPTTPEVPADMEGFTYDEANNIEQILLDVDLLITNMSLAWFYSGEIYSGEV